MQGWQGQGGYAPQASGGVAAGSATVEDRATFLVRTYLHLVGAIFAFIAIEAVLIVTGVAHRLLEAASFSRWAWLIFLGGFVGVSYLADRWARSDASRGMQYAGLVLYTVAEAVLFAPLVVMAMYVAVQDGGGALDILGKALWISLVLFAGLTGIVFITRKDFSFLRGFLLFGGLGAMALILVSILFGFSLGLFFMWAMVVFAGASILFNTSNVLHHYRTDQYVAAALNLFASFALLLWYVLSILMRSRD